MLRELDEEDDLDEAAFRHRLFKAATRKLVDRYRYYTREKRDPGRRSARTSAHCDDRSLVDCYAEIVTPSRVASAREELARVESAVERLPADQRDAVLMVKLLGLSVGEVAELQTRSESAVRGLVARGLATLALLLDPD